VTLYVNGKLIKSGAVNSSFIVQDGVASTWDYGYDSKAAIVRATQEPQPTEISISCGMSFVLGCIGNRCDVTDDYGNSCYASVGVCQDGYYWLEGTCFDFD
jgi:hypothetical protein